MTDTNMNAYTQYNYWEVNADRGEGTAGITETEFNDFIDGLTDGQRTEIFGSDNPTTTQIEDLFDTLNGDDDTISWSEFAGAGYEVGDDIVATGS